MHKRAILAVALALFFCLFTYSFASAATIRGKVIDKTTSQPIAEALVRVYDITGQIMAQTKSDSSGNYLIQKELSGIFFISLSAKDYKSQWAIRYIRAGSEYSLDFILEPTQPQVAQPPQIVSLSPAADSIFLAGAFIQIKPTLQNLGNSQLEYQFSIGGSVVQAWSPSNTYSWQTSSSDKGRVEITCEVRNSAGISSRSISIRILDPTPEEVLQRVAENYAKIQDFKADMVLSSTLDGKPFGETEYCRYYFKAPNEEKTEAYTDSTRTTIKEVMITGGSKLIMIDPVNNLRQEVDLLQETGLTSAQFNQMDLFYNQETFLRNHMISKDNSKTDFNNFIIALDAMPKETNNLYSKLELLIDYNKGMMTKSYSYREDRLSQTLEMAEAELMHNGAWFSKKIIRMPVLKSGTLIETASYDNIQINIRLLDSEFRQDK